MAAATLFKPTEHKVAQKERLLFVAGHANATAHLHSWIRSHRHDILTLKSGMKTCPMYWLALKEVFRVCLFCAHQSCFIM